MHYCHSYFNIPCITGSGQIVNAYSYTYVLSLQAIKPYSIGNYPSFLTQSPFCLLTMTWQHIHYIIDETAQLNRVTLVDTQGDQLVGADGGVIGGGHNGNRVWRVDPVLWMRMGREKLCSQQRDWFIRRSCMEQPTTKPMLRQHLNENPSWRTLKLDARPNSWSSGMTIGWHCMIPLWKPTSSNRISWKAMNLKKRLNWAIKVNQSTSLDQHMVFLSQCVNACS